MAAAGLDHLLLSVGSDLPYLTGYRAMANERLTMFVLPAAGQATMVVPLLEAVLRGKDHDHYGGLGDPQRITKPQREADRDGDEQQRRPAKQGDGT